MKCPCRIFISIADGKPTQQHLPVLLQLQRRAYWLLDLTEDKDLVLVHYLHVVKLPAGSESPEHPSATPASARAAAPFTFQPPATPGMAADTISSMLGRAPSPMQYPDPGPTFPGHSSGGSSSSASPMMLDLQQPAPSLRPPDPYMPLLPSMSLDSFFTAVDDHQGQAMRPLLSSSGSINLEPIILDSFGNAAEPSQAVPMDSLTLPGDLGNDWRVSPEYPLQTSVQPVMELLDVGQGDGDTCQQFQQRRLSPPDFSHACSQELKL